MWEHRQSGQANPKTLEPQLPPVSSPARFVHPWLFRVDDKGVARLIELNWGSLVIDIDHARFKESLGCSPRERTFEIDIQAAHAIFMAIASSALVQSDRFNMSSVNHGRLLK